MAAAASRANETSSPRVGPGPIPDTYLAHERLKIALLATFNLRAIQAKIRVSSLKSCVLGALRRVGGCTAPRTHTHRYSEAQGAALQRQILAVGAGRAPWAAAPERTPKNDGVPERAPAAAAAGAAAARARCFNCRERLELLAAQPHLRARVRDPTTMPQGMRERGLRAGV